MTDIGLPCHLGAAGQNASPRCDLSRQVVVELINSCAVEMMPDAYFKDPRALDSYWCQVPSTATPGQAGLPAEFKHINKRRKRN